jgi:hypothetical protein
MAGYESIEHARLDLAGTGDRRGRPGQPACYQWGFISSGAAGAHRHSCQLLLYLSDKTRKFFDSREQDLEQNRACFISVLRV